VILRIEYYEQGIEIVLFGSLENATGIDASGNHLHGCFCDHAGYRADVPARERKSRFAFLQRGFGIYLPYRSRYKD
jgi:hypothetical protein